MKLHAFLAAAFVMIAASGAGVSAQVALDVHSALGLACSDCHAEDPPLLAPPNAVCVACHGTMTDAPPPATLPGADPHRSPHLGPREVPVCAECHRIHSPSEVSCAICHQGFEFNIK
jgi:hypothetical protein